MMVFIRSFENEDALEFLEQLFVFMEEQKRAVLQQKVIFWTNAMADKLQREIEMPPDIVPNLMANWSISLQPNDWKAKLVKAVKESEATIASLPLSALSPRNILPLSRSSRST